MEIDEKYKLGMAKLNLANGFRNFGCESQRYQALSEASFWLRKSISDMEACGIVDEVFPPICGIVAHISMLRREFDNALFYISKGLVYAKSKVPEAEHTPAMLRELYEMKRGCLDGLLICQKHPSSHL